MNMNMNTIKAGDVVTIGTHGNASRHPSTFLGFTKTEQKYSETPSFDTLAEVKAHYSETTNVGLEAMNDLVGHGYAVYAVFRDEDDKTVWTAYLFKGRWVLGSSADPFKVEAADAVKLWEYDLGPVPAGYAEVDVDVCGRTGKGLHYQGC